MSSNRHQHDTALDKAETLARPLYVIGCPRSGTTYTSKVLRAADYEVKHEQVGADGTCDWRAIVRQIPDSAVVLHQIRHPLACITSMQTLLVGSYNRLMSTNAIKGNSFVPARRIEVCARAWLFYNVQCEAIADASFRVESDEEWSTACQQIGLPAIPRTGISLTTNSRQHAPKFRTYFDAPITLAMIENAAGSRIRTAIVRQAARYGYELSAVDR